MKQWSTHELHPLCTLFPRMIGEDFDALVADISANGLQSPIVLHDGMILDGGNRYRACQVANVEPRFQEFTGSDIVQYVLSVNLHRRHLAQGQIAVITSLAQDWNKAQPRGGDRRSDQSRSNDFDTVEKRAAASGVHRDTQMKADKVAKASPELARQVAHGEKTLPQAVREVSPPKLEQTPDACLSEADQIDEMSQEIAILRRELDAASKDNSAMGEAFDADDKLTVLHRQNKELREVNRVLQSRLDGEINKNAELVREVTKAQRKIERMERASVQVP